MKITKIVSNLLFSNMYIVQEGKHVLLIDPCITNVSLDPDVSVDRILLTHEHYDHISGVNYWTDKTNAPVLCSCDCAESIKDDRKNLSRYFKVFCELQTWVELSEPTESVRYKCHGDEIFSGSYKFGWENHNIELFSCPGHSPGSTGILVDYTYFFSGDALMRDYPIECGLPGGSRDAWIQKSLPRIRKLKSSVRVYPGHFEDFLFSDYKFW